jgi:hypothetical protein
MGELGKALRTIWDMEMDLERGKNKETMDPIMMDEEQIKEIMSKEGNKCSERPYQYKIISKKRVVSKREGLYSDEEVDNIHCTW